MSDMNRIIRERVEDRGRAIFFIRVLNFLDVINTKQYKSFFVEFKRHE